MGAQMTFGDLEQAGSRRTTRRKGFLDRMEGLVPWGAWLPLVEEAYYRDAPGKRGRKAVPAERMLRMYLLQLWFGLSDEGCEDACVDSYAMRSFLGVDLAGGEQVPDATTLCRFRSRMEQAGLGEAMLSSLNAVLEEAGVMMRGGSIVDATFVEAPSSTKNADRARDPEAHSAKKGNAWHFGYKAHAGVDAGSGLVHTVEVTAANVADVARAHSLLRPDDRVCYADAGYVGLEKRPEVAGDPALSKVDFRVARRRFQVPGRACPECSWEPSIESRLASVRAKVEHPFLVVKRQFGFAKTRYRGLAKTANALCALFALANLALVGRAGRSLARA